jgi:hypothetical protein
MDLASKIRGLCREIVACEDDARCIDMLEELRSALHVYIEAMRGNVIVFPMCKSEFDVDEPGLVPRYSKGSRIVGQ